MNEKIDEYLRPDLRLSVRPSVYFRFVHAASRDTNPASTKVPRVHGRNVTPDPRTGRQGKCARAKVYGDDHVLTQTLHGRFTPRRPLSRPACNACVRVFATTTSPTALTRVRTKGLTRKRSEYLWVGGRKNKNNKPKSCRKRASELIRATALYNYVHGKRRGVSASSH